MSSILRTETPARYISIIASSIELSLRLYLSIIAVSKGKFLSLGMFRVTFPEVVSIFLLQGLNIYVDRTPPDALQTLYG